MNLFTNRVFLATALFVGTLVAGSLSITKNHQLEMMDDMAEDYFYLAGNLYFFGKFYPNDTVPFVKRPPGYTFFIYSVLKVWGGMPEVGTVFKSAQEADRVNKRSYKAVYWAQLLLLAISAAALFLWLANHIRLRYALIAAILYGTNPYMIILCGLLHYELVHAFCLVMGCFLLDWAIREPEITWWKLAIAGVFWGLATLLRPISLLLPGFVLLLFVAKYYWQWKLILKLTGIFTLAMILTIAPYTYRNYAITGRFIPVNAQGYMAIWGSTVLKFERTPNHYKWWAVWYSEGLPLFQKITNQAEFTYHSRVANIFLMEEKFKEAAIENLKEKPGVYLSNIFTNFLTLQLDINSVYIKIYQFIQKRGNKFQKHWFAIGDKQEFSDSKAADSFGFFSALMALLSLGGIVLGIRNKDNFLLVPGAVYLCVCFAHTITYMDMMYYYMKVPFLFIFSAFFLHKLDIMKIQVPNLKWNISTIIMGIVLLYSLKLTAEIIM
ncbi:MAG TPA: hypothetical protein EYN51_03820 [Flavobacteriales bacterium]|nr:hypothetical protein [Flavobacteriales bacterium]